jgi:phosphomannomutase
MVSALTELLDKKKVAIISGGKYEQFQKQVISQLTGNVRLENLYLFPTCGASYYQFENGEWKNIYEERLPKEGVEKIFAALGQAQKNAWIITEWPFYGEQIEDRGTQVSWSALGQQCPGEIKSKWDPDQKKRLSMLPFLRISIPEYEVRVWGTTTIDVTRKWIDKKYGIYQMEKYLHIPLSEMLFIGGIDYRKTTDPEMTLELIEEILKEK